MDFRPIDYVEPETSEAEPIKPTPFVPPPFVGPPKPSPTPIVLQPSNNLVLTNTTPTKTFEEIKETREVPTFTPSTSSTNIPKPNIPKNIPPLNFGNTPTSQKNILGSTTTSSDKEFAESFVQRGPVITGAISELFGGPSAEEVANVGSVREKGIFGTASQITEGVVSFGGAGALTGSIIGSIIPGPGTFIGGLVGGIGGSIIDYRLEIIAKKTSVGRQEEFFGASFQEGKKTGMLVDLAITTVIATNTGFGSGLTVGDVPTITTVGVVVESSTGRKGVVSESVLDIPGQKPVTSRSGTVQYISVDVEDMPGFTLGSSESGSLTDFDFYQESVTHSLTEKSKIPVGSGKDTISVFDSVGVTNLDDSTILKSSSSGVQLGDTIYGTGSITNAKGNIIQTKSTLVIPEFDDMIILGKKQPDIKPFKNFFGSADPIIDSVPGSIVNTDTSNSFSVLQGQQVSSIQSSALNNYFSNAFGRIGGSNLVSTAKNIAINIIGGGTKGNNEVINVDDGMGITPIDDGRGIQPIDDGGDIIVIDDGGGLIPIDDGEIIPIDGGGEIIPIDIEDPHPPIPPDPPTIGTGWINGGGGGGGGGGGLPPFIGFGNIELGGGSRSPGRRSSQANKISLGSGYSPDIKSILFNITGKKPTKTSTGFENRPISIGLPTTQKKKTKKSKKKKKKKNNNNIYGSVITL